MRSLLLSAFVLGTMAITTTAKADVPPPDGQRFVDYAFTVRGLAAAPEQVVFAYPCSTSAGVPIAQHRVLQDGKAELVGRRGGECRLYTIKKATYDEWAKTYEPTNAFEDPALEQLEAKALLCAGAPRPTFVVTNDDARNRIEEDLEVKTLTETSCEITSKNPPTLPAEKGASPNDPASNADESASGAQPSSSSDDGGCSVGGSARHAGPWLLALGVPLFVFLGARRRKNEKKR